MLSLAFAHPYRMVVFGSLALGLGACAGVKPGDELARPVVTQEAAAPVAVDAAPAPAALPAPAAEPAPAPTPVAQSTVVELERLIRDREVSELRTTYNGSYGASLLFKPDELQYYVTLFQQTDFWRVVRTKQEKVAEDTYRVFSQQTYDLAASEIRRITLKAEQTLLEQELLRRAQDLNALRTDLALQRQQEDRVAAQQQQALQDAAQLAEQQDNAQKQLRSLQRQIEALEAEQNQVQEGLPVNASR